MFTTRYGISRLPRTSSSTPTRNSCSSQLDLGRRERLNISTLSNWCTRNMPPMSLPYVPASRRKHDGVPGVAQRQVGLVEDLAHGGTPPAAPRTCPPGRGRPRGRVDVAPRRSAGSRCRTSLPHGRAPAGSPVRTPCRRGCPSRDRISANCNEHDVAHQVDEPRPRCAARPLGVEHTEQFAPSSTWSRGSKSNAVGSP